MTKRLPCAEGSPKIQPLKIWSVRLPCADSLSGQIFNLHEVLSGFLEQINYKRELFLTISQ